MPASQPRVSWRSAVAVFAVILLCWVLPRLAMRLGGTDGRWAPFLYEYFLGGLVSTIGMVVIVNSRACDFRRPGDAAWCGALIGGYVAYALMHAAVMWLAHAVPFRGV